MKTKTNDQIILEQIVKERAQETGGEFSTQEYFEIYCASEVLKDHSLSHEDILYGIVDGGGDGGIDSVYTFVNGEPLKEDSTLNTNQRKNLIEVFIIQSKTTPSFTESTIVKLRDSLQDLLNLSSDLTKQTARYNKSLISQIEIFRSSYSKLAKTFPKLIFNLSYATFGTEVHPNVSGKVEQLRGDIMTMFSGAEFNFQFIGASKLLEMTRDIPSTSRILEVSESPIGTAGGSYVALVSLSKYYDFISDNGVLSRSIFDSNVRDYQGSVTVNTGIRNTLKDASSEDFWYLNNGVTIITPKAVLAGKQLTIEDPQIVNGLQTSHEIYCHFSGIENKEPDNRCLLVRVICEENEEARDRIIRATNSQTSIPPASLRSSDHIHRNIEDFLKSNDFYYDRKKNHYRNLGKPISQIVSIASMAQAMMAIALKKPDSARARPSTLINSDSDYKSIFSLDTPIDVYLKAIQIIKITENFLRSEACFRPLDRKEITNIKFYVARHATALALKNPADMVSALHELGTASISTELLDESAKVVYEAYVKLGGNDQVAKGSELVKEIL